MTTLIVWRKAKQPKRDGNLKHRIVVSGPQAQAVHDWFEANNMHGLWRLGAVTQIVKRNPQTGAIRSMGEPTFDCEVWAEAADAAAVKRADSVIAMFKLAWGGDDGETRWRQH